MNQVFLERHFAEFLVRMYHVKDISAEALDNMAREITAMLKEKYPVIEFEGDIEVECVCYSGVREEDNV
jgi:hypothetical protein